MRRLLDGLGAMLTYLCIATVLAQAVLASYLWLGGYLGRARLVDMLAAAYGIREQKEQTIEEKVAQNDDAVQASLEEILQRRARMSRQLEMRQSHLDANLQELGRISRELKAERSRVERQRGAFESRLKEINEDMNEAAQQQVAVILKNAKPKQAKSQLMLMWTSGETERVATLLLAMPEANRKKIVAEFRSKDEEETLAEILREIGQRGPRGLIETTRERLGAVEQSPRR